METTTLTIEQFISKHYLKFECHRVESRPDGLMDGKYLESPPASPMRHFRCRITRPAHITYAGDIPQGSFKTRSFGLYFSQGSAHTADPTLADVLDCLAMDVSGYENSKIDSFHYGTISDFASWCEDFGYDPDSRKAEKIYKTVKRQAEQLKRTLGAEAYQELLWNTGRL